MVDWYTCMACGQRAEKAVTAEFPTCPGRGDAPCGGEWVVEAPLRMFNTDGRLDVGSVARLVDAAQVIVEGHFIESLAAPGQGPLFLGTALISIDLASIQWVAGPRDADFARRLRGALAADRRTRSVFHDRAMREAARMLGAETPSHVESVATLRARGTTILIDLDLEGQIESGAKVAVKRILRRQPGEGGDAVPAELDTAQHLPLSALGLGSDRRLPRASDARTTIDQAPSPETLAEMRAETAEAYRASDLDAVALALGLGARPAGLGDIEWQAVIEEEAERLRQSLEQAIASEVDLRLRMEQAIEDGIGDAMIDVAHDNITEEADAARRVVREALGVPSEDVSAALAKRSAAGGSPR